tara:strand:+ start:1050 stop:1274 length:225 start_codon:yes stop_codon:yes gene_type:complete
MKQLFERLIGTKVLRNGEIWYLVGYNDCHFIIGRKTKDSFSKKEIEPKFLLNEYENKSFRYEYCSENELLEGFK